MDEQEKQHIKEEMDIAWKIADRVRKYVPGQLHWVAGQKMDKPGHWYGFAIGEIGRRFACIEIEEARNADDAVIRRLATEIMGYEPDSAEDLARRLDELDAEHEVIQDEFDRLDRRRKAVVQKRVEVRLLLEALKT